MTEAGAKKNPLIESGCLIPSAIGIAFFAYLAYSDPKNAKVSFGYITLFLALVAAFALFSRLSPYSQAAETFGRSEIIRLRRAAGERIATARELTPREFEYAVGHYFEIQGWDVEVTRATGDGGKDLVLRKDGATVLVEIKLFGEGKKVGRPAVMKLHSAVIHERAATGIFVSTSEFTKQAEEFAALNQLTLIDGTELGLRLESAFPNAESMPHIRVMCRKCGSIEVYHDLSASQIACAKGHNIPNPVPPHLRIGVGPQCVDCGVEMVRVRVGGTRHGRYVCPKCRQPHRIERGQAGA